MNTTKKFLTQKMCKRVGAFGFAVNMIMLPILSVVDGTNYALAGSMLFGAMICLWLLTTDMTNCLNNKEEDILQFENDDLEEV